VVVVPPAPSPAPARVRRVGEVPVPRVRPLADVLPHHPRPAPPPGADPGARTRQAQDELDRVAAALRPVAARLLTAVADVLAGRRPPAHLDGLLAPAALAALVRATSRPGVAPTRPPRGNAPGPGLRGLRVCAVDRRAAEVAAVVHGRDRVRALAARLERDDGGPADPGRWRLVALRTG
jgi:hypothetical protein